MTKRLKLRECQGAAFEDPQRQHVEGASHGGGNAWLTGRYCHLVRQPQ